MNGLLVSIEKTNNKIMFEDKEALGLHRNQDHGCDLPRGSATNFK
jgi:hypothetical protein